MTYDDLIPKPTSDLFTAVLWSAPKNEPILRSFINAVLIDTGMSPIAHAEVLNPYNIKDFAVDKAIILDVRVRDNQNHLYDIEIQVAAHRAFNNRILHYWSNIYTSQLQSGENYTKLRPVISIVITEFPIFPELEKPHTLFQVAAQENPGVLLTDHLQIHFVRLSELQRGHREKLEGMCRELRHWLNFFVFAAMKTEEEMSGLTDNDPIIQEAYAELRRFYANGESREKIRQRERFILDYESGIDAAKLEGKEEGKAEGKAGTILQILTKRLGKPSGELESKLFALTDLEQLDKLADMSLDCVSLEEFEKALR